MRGGPRATRARIIVVRKPEGFVLPEDSTPRYLRECWYLQLAERDLV